MKQFYGADEISSTKDFEYKGNQFTEITFTNGNKLVVAKPTFDLLVTDKQNLDATGMRDKKGYSVVQELLSVFFKWGVKLSEVEYMIQMTIASLQENEKKAVNTLYGKDTREITMLDIDQVLVKGDKKTLDDIL